MTSRSALSSAVGKIAWGYLFLHLHINLGALDILPDWVFFFLLLQALQDLGETIPSMKLLRPLAILLGLWSAVQWIGILFGISLKQSGWSVLRLALSLYLHYQLLTDLSVLATQSGIPGTAKWILQLRTARTVLETLYQLPLVWSWANEIWPDGTQVVLWITSALYILTVFLICHALFTLRRALAAEDSDNPL